MSSLSPLPLDGGVQVTVAPTGGRRRGHGLSARLAGRLGAGELEGGDMEGGRRRRRGGQPVPLEQGGRRRRASRRGGQPVPLEQGGRRRRSRRGGQTVPPTQGATAGRRTRRRRSLY